MFYVAIPPFSPSVLKPRLDLSVCHLQGLGQGGALCRRQVLLPMKALLQLTDLDAAERRAWLFPLGWRTVLVRVPDPPSHREWRQGRCGSRKEYESVSPLGGPPHTLKELKAT